MFLYKMVFTPVLDSLKDRRPSNVNIKSHNKAAKLK